MTPLENHKILFIKAKQFFWEIHDIVKGFFFWNFNRNSGEQYQNDSVVDSKMVLLNVGQSWETFIVPTAAFVTSTLLLLFVVVIVEVGSVPDTIVLSYDLIQIAEIHLRFTWFNTVLTLRLYIRVNRFNSRWGQLGGGHFDMHDFIVSPFIQDLWVCSDTEKEEESQSKGKFLSHFYVIEYNFKNKKVG